MARHARPSGYYDLLADLQRPGCAVCQTSRSTAQRVIDLLLYESANDPGMRSRLRSSHGFCVDHALLALQIAARSADGQALGLIYSDVLEHVRADADRQLLAWRRPRWLRWRRPRARPLGAHTPCPVCVTVDARADRYLRLLAEADPAGEIGTAARRDDRGVCLPHLSRGLAGCRSRAQAENLTELFSAAEERIRADVAESLRKSDPRFADEAVGREQNAWRRALLWVVGLPAHTSSALAASDGYPGNRSGD